jgi:hypothetical protein
MNVLSFTSEVDKLNKTLNDFFATYLSNPFIGSVVVLVLFIFICVAIGIFTQK